LKFFNIALLGKWKWRLGKKERGLWRDIITSKYGSLRALNESKDNRYDSLWWRDLGKVCGNREGTTKNHVYYGIFNMTFI